MAFPHTHGQWCAPLPGAVVQFPGSVVSVRVAGVTGRGGVYVLARTDCFIPSHAVFSIVPKPASLLIRTASVSCPLFGTPAAPRRYFGKVADAISAQWLAPSIKHAPILLWPVRRRPHKPSGTATTSPNDGMARSIRSFSIRAPSLFPGDSRRVLQREDTATAPLFASWL